MVTPNKEYYLDTRPLSEFERLGSRAVGEYMEDAINMESRHPAGSILQRVFWDAVDPGFVWYGKPHVLPGFKGDQHICFRGHRQWEFVAASKYDPSATVRMIVEHTDKVLGADPERDKRFTRLSLYPVSLLDVKDAGSWKVIRDVDGRRLFVQLDANARDSTRIFGEKRSSIEVHFENAGQNPGGHLHFVMETEESSFSAGRGKNNALVLATAGKISRLCMEYKRSRLL